MTLYKIYYQTVEEKLPIASLNIHPDYLKSLADWGIVEIQGDHIDARNLRRLYKIIRFRNVMNVNLNGAAIIVDLLDRIEELEQEIRDLKTGR